MALITVIITESERQRISGIPEFVTIITSIPSTIFYTFDGTDPNTSSDIYVGGELKIPTNQPSVTFKVLATNGTDSSAIIERFFRPNIIIVRKSHDRVVVNNCGDCGDCSTCSPTGQGQWTSFGPDDLIVDKPSVENIFDGYDGTATGTPTGGTDLDLSEYLIKFSDSNRANTERGRGIGTLPSEVTVVMPPPPPTFSDRNSSLFNPRALVIYQDSREEPDDPSVVNINRQFFSLQNPETTKDGILLNTTAFEGNTITGSLLRTHFNPRENTLTYYYFDSHALRWIISIEPFTPASPRTSGLQKIMFSSRSAADQKVFRWIPFKGRSLM